MLIGHLRPIKSNRNIEHSSCRNRAGIGTVGGVNETTVAQHAAERASAQLLRTSAEQRHTRTPSQVHALL